MKETMKFIEVCFAKEKKPFLILYGVTLAVLLMLQITLIAFSDGELGYTPFHIIQSNGIGYLLIVTFFIFLFLHGKRIARLGRNGAVRIMMLPISPYTYFIAQLIFVFATMCFLISVFSISYIITFFYYALRYPILDNHFIYMLNAAPFSELFLPVDLSNLILTLSMMFTISLLFCICASAIHSSELLGKIILTGMILSIPALLLFSFAMSVSFFGYTPTLYIAIGLLLIDALLLRIEYKWLRLRKVAG